MQPKAIPAGVNEQVVRSKTGSPLLQKWTAPLITTPNNLSTLEFPALGSKAEEKSKEGKGPVFYESFYSQLREVHGANMRAAEALQEDSVGRLRRDMSADDVNSLADDVMRALAAEGEHVTIDRVCVFVFTIKQTTLAYCQYLFIIIYFSGDYQGVFTFTSVLLVRFKDRRSSSTSRSAGPSAHPQGDQHVHCGKTHYTNVLKLCTEYTVISHVLAGFVMQLFLINSVGWSVFFW